MVLRWEVFFFFLHSWYNKESGDGEEEEKSIDDPRKVWNNKFCCFLSLGMHNMMHKCTHDDDGQVCNIQIWREFLNFRGVHASPD